MNLLFPPELRTASIVRRWSIVRTLSEDNVANHSFYVVYYAMQVARLIDFEGSMEDLMFVAWAHDLDETITGDIVSPVKSEIIDEAKSDNYIYEKMKERLPGIVGRLEEIEELDPYNIIGHIVKVADRIDAVLFLLTENKLGNAALAELYQKSLDLAQESWIELCTLVEFKGERTWNDEIYPAIQSHWKFGGKGV